MFRDIAISQYSYREVFSFDLNQTDNRFPSHLTVDRNQFTTAKPVSPLKITARKNVLSSI